jgi:hypothetical protein
MHHPSGIGSVGRGCTGSCPAPERQGVRMDLDELQTGGASHGQRPSSGRELPTQSVKAEGCSCSAGADPCCDCTVFAPVIAPVVDPSTHTTQGTGTQGNTCGLEPEPVLRPQEKKGNAVRFH